MMYHKITDGLPRREHLEIDEILGSKRAHEELKKLRRETATAAGFEVG